MRHFLLTALATVTCMAGPLVALATPAAAQMTEIDPNSAIDADLNPPAAATSSDAAPPPSPGMATDVDGDLATSSEILVDPAATAPATATAAAASGDTFKEDDLIGAAEGVFGKGAQGLAMMIQKVLKDQGEPNAYIVGREAGGALVVGVRYGSGTLHHKVEGETPAYWTGPSIGFDAGANAAQTFVLVYNLYSSDELFKRYPAGEGAAYLLGGFNASYLRRGDVVMIPIRLGVGARLGANVGYMKFRRKQSWVPF